MRAIAQGQAAILQSYERPLSSSQDSTDIAAVTLWSLLGLAVSALCVVSGFAAGVGDLLAFAG